MPALMIAIIALSTFSVQFGGWSSLVIPVGVIGLAAALFGLLVAKARVSDSLAHFGAMLVGVAVVFTSLLFAAESLGDGWRDRIRPMATFLFDWYMGRRSAEAHEELLISLLMGLIIWLVGYLSAWIFFRRGWLLAALFLPGLLLVVNEGFVAEPEPWRIAAMLALAIPLAARHHLFQRQKTWASRNMRSPVRLGGRVLIITTVLGLLITLASWSSPESWSQASVQPALQAISDQVAATRDRASDWLSQVTGEGEGNPDAQAGSYTAFDDAFSVGGPLELTAEEEVLVRTSLPQAPYLTAHHYDTYTGRGWKSGISDGFIREGPNGEQYSPELLFQPGQEVVLSSDVAGERTQVNMTVEPLSGESGVIFSVDTYQTASVPAVVRMSWTQLDDEAFTVTGHTLTSLPPDIQLVASLLLRAELTGEGTGRGPVPVDPDLRQRLEQETANLQRRMIDVRWEATPDGTIQAIYVSGQLPVYDDVEAVFPRNAEDSADGASYDVTSLTSTADPDALMGAGVDYPEWVTDRYLQLGDTVTPETVDLALQIAAEGTSPYEQAVLIEHWLRENIVYDERVEAPPEDADVVDYVLFDNRRGYCEHYSSSMTVMMRALGVPARTVVGYYPGDFDQSRDGFVYRQLNAHAWTEVFFPGYGWIPFEPTANRPLSDRPDVADMPTETPVPTEEPLEMPEMQPTEDPIASPTVPAPAFDGSQPPQISETDGDGDRPAWLVPVAAAVISLGVLGVGGWFFWSRGLRGLTPGAGLYARLLRIGQLAGIRPGRTTTPREYAVRLERAAPSVGPAARRIVQVYEMEQYGEHPADDRLMTRAKEAWRQVRNTVPRLLFRRRRS